ncbi:MAG: signal recognition particle-docking protein FtsY [Gammaproteobacteria bacterium]
MFRKITLLSVVLALVVIVLGAYVRLSDAGLGCPDWPGCYGKPLVSESEEYKAQAKAIFPDQPLDIGKAWKEMIHRYVAGTLGLLILTLAIVSWRVVQHRTIAVAASLGLLILVGFQAALGMWTVTMKVMPIIVTGHLLMGLVTFWTLFWLYLRVNPHLWEKQEIKGPRGLAFFSMLVLFIQIFLGGWTSTNYAALACQGFPHCNGSWWPEADYTSALDILNGLLTGETEPLGYEGRVAAHWMHRIGALTTFLILSVLILRATSSRYDKPIRKAGVVLSSLLLIQIGLGIYNVGMGLPLPAAVAHNGVAALMMLPLIVIGFYSRYSTLERSLKEDEGIAAPGISGVEQTLIAEESYVEKSPDTLFLRLKSQLGRTRAGLGEALSGIALNKKAIDEELLEEIETRLITADVGIDATSEIIGNLTESVKRSQLTDGEALTTELKSQLLHILEPCSEKLAIPDRDEPFVILVVGVNGVGKTTTIGKLAKRLQAHGHSVMLAAGDTFRAAAVEQLQTWGERNNIHVVAQHTGADSASVIFDGVQSARAKGIDVLIADTAGRLHTKSNLMDELIKIKRIIGKLDPTAPHEVLLVLDAGTGQNALSQAKLFNDAVKLTGIALTKLDGTAKGGVIFALAKQFGIPIRFIGVGESIDDLQDFDAEKYIEALFSNEA